ncbi:SpaH/EbpB family LPXTG-anchored major pilin [Enterococcus sp. DIV0800]|uniref:SpaH/EbpB family LPXTG-anchored major pilin n=1 Tax=unclassified Enterococcus TaxID=2608891 RepID=UPI003D2FB90C
MKKIIKFLAVMAMMLSGLTGLLGLGSEAEAFGTDSVDVTIHKLKVIDDYPPHQNTGVEDDHWAGIDGLDGVTFEAFDVTDKYYEYLADYKTSNPNMPFKEVQKLVVAQIQADANNRRAGDFNYADSKGSDVTAADGTVKFENLADKKDGRDAVYVFVETASIHPTEKAENPMVVALPIFKIGDSNTREKNRDIHIYPKNEISEGTGEKVAVSTSGEVTANGYGTVNIGDTIDYEVTIPLTDLMQTLQIKDVPSKGLDYVDNTASIDGLGSITINGHTEAGKGNGFIVELSEADLNELRDAGKTEVKLTYQMVVTSEALPDELLTNDAEVSLDDGANWVPTDKPEDPDKPTDFYTGGKKFIKKDPNLNEILQGAKFAVVKLDDQKTPTHYLTKDAEGNVIWEDITNQDPATWTDAEILESNNQGNFEVTGLMYSEGFKDGESYALVETEAPNGYVVLDEPFEFEIVKDGYGDPAGILEVENIPAGFLPETGGKGIYLFLMIGAMLMAGAAIWYKRSKKQSAQV